MNSVVTTLTTIAQFSNDGAKRYLLQKEWDDSKPTLAVVMMAPSEASGVALDSTTLLVLNNASRLGYGRVSIVNLFATLNDFALKEAEAEDQENVKTILSAAQNADAVVYAPGVGKTKNKAFQQRQEQVLAALRPIEDKLYCLCDANGKARLQHPLSPAVRQWHLSRLSISELIPVSQVPITIKKETITTPKEKKHRGRPAKEASAPMPKETEA